MEDKKHFMNKAVEAGLEAIHKKEGGPFGAVVVKDDKIIGYGKNQVEKETDPTAHAEVVAIRNACKNLGDRDLTGCILYSSCEPCPMCFGAIYWANISKVYYGCSIIDSSGIGFRDRFIYEEIKLDHEKRESPFDQIYREDCLQPFKEWANIESN